MDQQTKDLIYLTSCILNRKKPDQTKVKNINLKELYKMACLQKMVFIAACAIREAGVKAPIFEKEKMIVLTRSFSMEMEWANVAKALEEAGIWYMPLKGIILKNYYPQPYFREMADNDILFDSSRAEDVRRIMESMGFETHRFGSGHDDDYRKEPVSNFEMHRMLFKPTAPPRIYKYYKNIKKKLREEDGFLRSFSNEDFYLYMVTHEYKHYYDQGTGLRSLMDVYVFLSKFKSSLDWKYIQRELKKLGIEDFERRNRILAKKLFSRGNIELLTSSQKRMLENFVSGGAFGNHNRTKHGIKMMEDGKGRYFLKRIFLPLSDVRENYPFFYRHRKFLPLLPVYRLIRGGGAIPEELKEIIKT